jgi:hypothetical protein
MPTPTSAQIAAADAAADATGQRAAKAKKELKLAKLRYKAAKKALKLAKKTSRKAAKLARKARRRLDELQEVVPKTVTADEPAKAAVKARAHPGAKIPKQASARGRR